MGILSATQSISRYYIDGTVEGPVMDEIRSALIRFAIPAMENEYEALSAGWTPFESPYHPDFETCGFVFGTYFVFSLRIDKKSIPRQLLEKHLIIEMKKKMELTGRSFMSKNEKSELKETVVDTLMRNLPAVPSLYDILWNHEDRSLYFFSTQKAANEIFETLFHKSFRLKPVRLFPYTLVETRSSFSDTQKDRILSLTAFAHRR